MFPQESSRGSDRLRFSAVDTCPSLPVRGASGLWNPHPPPRSACILPTPACPALLLPKARRLPGPPDGCKFQPHCQFGCLILDGHLGDFAAHPCPTLSPCVTAQGVGGMWGRRSGRLAVTCVPQGSGWPPACSPGWRKATRAFEAGRALHKCFLQVAGLGSPALPQLSHSPPVSLT